MTHRRSGVLVAAVIALAATGCNGDDDTTDATTTPPPDTSAVPPTTEAPPTTESTTTSTTEPATTTTVDIESLKAQIAEDYLRAEEAREVLVRNPTLENLESRVGAITVPGSSSYESLLAFVRGMVERGERVVPGQPDYSEFTVESVNVTDLNSGTAELTVCLVTNEARVGLDGQPLDGTGVLKAGRLLQPVSRTADGWLVDEQPTVLSVTEGVTECPG